MRKLTPLWLMLLLAAGCRPAHEVVTTKNAPAAIGPYSQAVRAGNTLYLSGQLGLEPATGALAPGGVAPQTRRALENCKAVLAAAGFTMADVVQVQVFLEDIDDYAAMNAVYAGYFPDRPPARAAFEVGELPRNAKVEILMVAMK